MHREGTTGSLVIVLVGVRLRDRSDQRLVLLVHADQLGVQIVDATLNLGHARLCACGTFAGGVRLSVKV